MNKDAQELLKQYNGDAAMALKDLTGKLTPQEAAWLSGYFSGAADARLEMVETLAKVGGTRGIPATAVAAPVVAPTALTNAVTILFASHSGNGKSFSKKAKVEVEKRGWTVKLASMSEIKTKDLKNETNLLIVISTHGEGVPPPAAETMFEFLNSNRAPKLDGMKFSILALGDKSYVHYCKAGIDLDRRLEELGATRISGRVDCDVDFQEDAEKWLDAALTALGPVNKTGGMASVGSAQTVAISVPAEPEGKNYSSKEPFQALVLSNVNLIGRGSDKETHHIELSIEGSGIKYLPGDACGLVSQNSEKFVADVISHLKLNGDDKVTTPHGEQLLAQALKSYELTVLTTDVIKKHNALAGSQQITDMFDDVAKVKEYIYGRDFLDLVAEYPVSYKAQDLLNVLRPLPARLYSIASGPSAYDNELHLLVGVVRYNAFGRNKEGVASTFWADRIKVDERVSIYIKSNDGFRLPHDGGTPILMVGPGTGVAPFRSFVEERAARGQKGKSWLFFGNPHFTTDFLYQTEWQQHLSDGNLTRMDVAFSRDQHEKIYVQDKILKNSTEVYRWMQDNATIYVCGDMKRMALDVHSAFVQVVEREGGLSHEKALEYVRELKRTGRYLEDVY